MNTETIKGYELREQLGAGGFGKVYKAFQSTVGREVAVKIILPALANQSDFIRRFEGEAQLVARLEHPHITPLYDYWRDPEGAYLVMRWLRGGSVQDALKSGKFELRAAALLLDQIAGALSLAHRNGIIHRDIKPANILLDEDGNAYLTDFGIAKDLNIQGNNTQPDVIVGSLDYISPEQARSEPVTNKTDIYSLGVTLFEMITGHHPFEKMSSVERLFKHINDPLPDITGLDAAIADQVNHVIQKATAKNPDQRFADALAFAADFREAIGLNRSSTTVEELLTQREHEILQLIIAGMSNKEIAQHLTLTLGTVKWHANQIYSKLGVRSRVQAMVRARELNLLGKAPEMLEARAVPTEDFHPHNPYKGLRAFQSADNQDFFGREKLTAKLLKRMAEASEFSRFLAVVGPSGSGKSSLVKAGLIPALWRGELHASEKWYIVEMTPGINPIDELEIALIKLAANQAANLHEQLSRDAKGLLRAANLILPNDETELVLVIDQFEEVFTLSDNESERSYFLNLLYAAVSSPKSRIRVILTLRADFYDRPLHYPHFGEMLKSRLETILPLSAEELEAAIRKPAERVGAVFETGLVASIVADMKYQAGALPLLQYALTELFEHRKGRLLSREAYDAMGKSIGVLAKRADEVYLEFDEAGKAATKQLFLRLVTVTEGAEDTRRRASRMELLALGEDAEVIEDVIDAYSSYRLLTLDNDPISRTPTVELAHEAILREWERLRNWLTESRDELRVQRQLSVMTQEWAESKRDKSFLARGIRLQGFEAWAENTTILLTPIEREFISKSLEERQAEVEKEAEQQARENVLKQRSQRFLQALVAVFALAAILSGGLAAFAFNREAVVEEALNISEERADYASSIALASAARNALSLNNTDQAISLAMAANTVIENPPAFSRNILYESAFLPSSRWVLPEAGFARVVISPDGNTALALRDDNSAAHLDLNTGAILSQWTPAFMGADDFICADGLLFSPDGNTAYVEMVAPDFSTGAIIEFEVATGDEVRRFVPPEGFPCHSSYSADGKSLLIPTLVFQPDTNSLPGSIYHWELATGNLTNTVVLDVSGLASEMDIFLSISEDNTRVAGTFYSGVVTLWDANTGERLFTVENDALAGRVWTINFVEDGILSVHNLDSRLATTAILWDKETGEVLREQTWESNSNKVEISHDRTTLAIAFQSTNLTLVDLEDWQELTTLSGHGHVTLGVDFTPDDQQLISVSIDGTVRFWNLSRGNMIRQLEGFSNVIAGIAVSPDRTLMAIQEYSPIEGARLSLWNLETGEFVRSLGDFQDSFRGIAFSPDGTKIVATSSRFDLGQSCRLSDSTVALLDVETGQILWEVTKDGSLIFGGTTFTGDGSKIVGVSSECGDPLHVFDAATGQILETWTGHDDGVMAITASRDEKWLATGSWDATAILWDAATGTIAQRLTHDAAVVSVAFSPDSRLLLTATVDNRLHIWNLENGQKIKELAAHTASVWFTEFSPNGHYIVASDQSFNVFVWDWQAGEVVRQFSVEQFGPAGTTANFSPDGQSIYIQTVEDEIVIQQLDLMLDESKLMAWIAENRYLRELTCDERLLYRIEPLCDS